ncbi:hypothetical protein POVWA2_023940 [Plasmodium ovale wallikeri]|uniref:PIR Superfamily Protein n=1 Tax=Plasmodium ovale wallikeri TaxID=864142 RepID=A0A1A8YTN3_PLAOA|nr:hypothetical protein POVWA1_024050 [Plasmodium ovale wallikeri]SBT35216.1 hypothetical protein POVWA2_023940 [Plasmodium ovale wallikeri]
MTDSSSGYHFLIDLTEIPQRAVEYLGKGATCLFGKEKDQECIGSFLRLLSFVGCILLIIGLICTYLYRSGLCCCKPSSANEKNEENDLYGGFEDMQQQQLFNSLMAGVPMNQQGDKEGKKKKKSSKNKPKTKKKNSENDNINIGYQGNS